MHLFVLIESTHQNKKLKLNVGGAANQLIEILRSYEKIKEIKISLATKYSEYIPKTNKVKIYQIHKFKFTPLDTLYFMVKIIKKIKKIHKKEHIDVIDINGNPFYVLSAYISRFLFKIPILMKMPLDFDSYIRWVYMLENKKLYAQMVNFSFFKFFKIFLLKKTDFIRPINAKMAKDLVDLKFPKKRILLIPNGIDRKKYENIAIKSRNIVHFGYVGRLTEFKNLRFLVEVFQTYLSKYPEDKLLIYGEGSEKEWILDFIKRNNLEQSIVFEGYEKDKTKIYSNIDVIINPALAQGISNVNLEAMSTKTLVIAANVHGNRDLIKHGTNGLLFNPFEKPDLLKQLYCYKENSGNIQKIIINAENEIIQKYDIDVIANRIYNFFNTFLKNRKI
ncbi:MAG: glycosyltransferase family 4 protein [Promethearchaeota archaeon]